MGYRRALPSFPTRRSSDLRVAPPPPEPDGPLLPPPLCGWFDWLLLPPPRRRTASSRFHFAAARSEEHTSELQSQFHLVCRLLLEKKNKTRLWTRTRADENT